MTLRILLSAFACVPGGGSEEGGGWAWAETLSRTHHVDVLTDGSHRAAIEADPITASRDTLRFHYLGTGPRSTEGLTIYRYYYRWQRAALAVARRLHAQRDFDVVHHVTYGSYRVPSYLYELDIPFLFGPVGGGERPPISFITPRWVGWRGSALEAVRMAWNLSVRVDPRLRRMARSAALCLFATPQSRADFPADVPSMIAPLSHLPEADRRVLLATRASPPPPTGMRVLYAGRLVGWKGPVVALHAFARYARSFPEAHFDLIGDGPLREVLAARASELGIADRVSLLGRRPREELLAAYADHHAFLFPSLHDSSGFVVKEAMTAGLPIVCLDIGGTGQAVPAGAGVKLVASRPRQAVRDLADGLAHLTRDVGAWHAASDSARAEFADQHVSPYEQIMSEAYGRVGLL